jgi:hypothetical protein
MNRNKSTVKDYVLLLNAIRRLWDHLNKHRNEKRATLNRDSENISTVFHQYTSTPQNVGHHNLERSSSGLLLMLDLYHHVHREG